MNNSNPPERAERLVKWSLAPWERPAVMGDLQEEFRDLVAAAGEPAARRWYWRQALTSAWPNFMRRLKADDQRRSRWWASITMIANGFLMTALGFVASSPARPAPDFEMPGFGVVWMVLGTIGALQSVFRKRVTAPVAQCRAQTAYAMLTAIAGFTAFLFLPRPPRYSEPVWLLGLAALEIWPWWPKDPPPAEFVVRPKPDPDHESATWLTIAVPNAPLGLSGLVLLPAHASATVEAAPRPIYFYEPTLQRTFTPSDTVRVCAVVNLVGPPVPAVVDVVDADGCVTRTVRRTIDAGSLEQVLKTWDEIADDDPAQHFGQVDVTLPLADLTPGPYRLRVTVTGAAATVQREEAIVVRATRS